MTSLDNPEEGTQLSDSSKYGDSQKVPEKTRPSHKSAHSRSSVRGTISSAVLSWRFGAARDDDPVLKKERRELPFYRRLAFGAAHVMHVFAVALWYPYDVIFYTKVIGLPAASVGTIILVGQVVGAVSSSFVGVWADHTRIRNYRRKVFHLLGMVLGVSSIFFMWFRCINCENAPPEYQVVYYCMFAAMFQFSWACVQIPQQSLIPELAGDSRNINVELNSIRFGFTMGAFLAMFVFVWVFFSFATGNSTNIDADDAYVFWIAALVLIVIGLPLEITFQLFVKEKSGSNPPRLPWYKWFTNPDFYIVLVLFMVSRVVEFFPQTYLTLYFVDTLKMDKSSVAKGPLIIFIFSILTSVVAKKLNKWIGLKMTYFGGLVIIWISLMWLWAMDPTDDSHSAFNIHRDIIYGATALLGVGEAACIVISFAMITQLIGKFTGSSAFVYGCMFFGDRFINGVIVKVIQSFQPEDGADGGRVLAVFYRHALVLTTLSASIVGLLTLALLCAKDQLVESRSKKKHHSDVSVVSSGVQ